MASVRSLYEAKPRPGKPGPGWVGSYEQFKNGFDETPVEAWYNFWEMHAESLGGFVDVGNVTDPDELWAEFFSEPDKVKFTIASDGQLWAIGTDSNSVVAFDYKNGFWNYHYSDLSKVPEEVMRLARGG